MAIAVFGIAKSESQAITIADNLKAAGFTENDVSVLFPDKKGTKDFAHEQHTKLPRARRPAQPAAQCWAVFGLDGGYRSTGHPGTRTLHRSGSHHGSFSGRGRRCRRSGLTGPLIGMGIPEYEAKRYEGKVKDGNILMSVHTEDSKERDRAKEIFVKGGAEDISYTVKPQSLEIRRHPTARLL